MDFLLRILLVSEGAQISLNHMTLVVEVLYTTGQRQFSDPYLSGLSCFLESSLSLASHSRLWRSLACDPVLPYRREGSPSHR